MKRAAKKNSCGEEKIKLEKYCLRTRMHLLKARQVLARRIRKRFGKNSKFESENRNLMNCIVRLEKRVESERNEDKDNSKRGRHFERKAVWE